MLQYVAAYCSVLQYVAVCCSVLQCVAVRCHTLQRVAVCCSVLQYVAIHRSVLQYYSVLHSVVLLKETRHKLFKFVVSVLIVTKWPRLIECLQLQVSFHKRATSYRALLQKITYTDKASYDSTPPCISLYPMHKSNL